jgi:hypothetical protein
MTDETPKTNLFGKPPATTPTESKPVVEERAPDEPVRKESGFEVQYASNKISRLRIGKFQFEHGVLTIDNEEDAAQFEKLLEGATVRTRQSVTKVDRAAGEKVAEQFLAASRGQMIRGGETSSSSPPAATPGDQKHVA